MQAQIVIGAVEKKEGTSKKTGKPYTKYVIHDQNSQATFDTFDGGIAQQAHDSVGKPASVEFKQSQFGNDIEAFHVAEFAEPHPAANGSLPTQQHPDGTADWDIIGLRKTRCLLWAHLLGSDAFWGSVRGATSTDEIAQIYAAASKIVEVAESDIYWRDPATKDASIPF